MRYYLFLLLLFTGCKSAERIAQEKAEKAEKERKLEQALLQRARQEYPCVPVEPLIKGVTVYIPGEKIPCPDNGTGRRDSIQCPPSTQRVDTSRILDMAHLRQYQDSLASERYYRGVQDKYIETAKNQIAVLTHSRDLYKQESKGKTKTIIWLSLVILVLTGWTFRKIILALFGKLI